MTNGISLIDGSSLGSGQGNPPLTQSLPHSLGMYVPIRYDS